MPDSPDFSNDILDYLRRRRGQLSRPLKMVTELTERVKDRTQSRKLRGRLLSTLALLIKQKKVIRYRKKPLVRGRPRSAQGFIRVSELYC